MCSFVLTKKAVADLGNIWNYTFDYWSESQADRYYLLLVDTFNEIARNPKIGKKYEGIGLQFSGFLVGSHIIFYKENNIIVEIIRILHQRMDLKNRIVE